MASHTEANYNKFTNQGKGTLVGNWAEERALREFTNVGRTIVKEHIPKKHLDFENPINSDKVFDNTNQRIYGQFHETPFISESFGIGKSTNPADNLPKFGQKTKNIEAEIMAQVNAEMAEKERAQFEQTQKRYFETTTGATHAKMDYQQNTIGRKVMRTQDGQAVSFNERDEQLIVEHGTWRRLQKQPDDELWQKIPKGDYTQQQPVTHWTHTLDRKNFYMSADVGPNPFAKTSGFTQTVDQVKSVSGYWGNIDFEQAQKRNEFRKSTGTDLNLGNPYIVQEVPVNNLQDIAARIICACKNKAPAHGLRALRVALKGIEQNGMVEPVAFKFALRQFGIEVSEEEGKALLKNFDPMRSGCLSVNEIFHCIRSPSWNAQRESMVEAAYSNLPGGRNETVTIADLEGAYDVTPNPEYQAGTKTQQQLTAEFLGVWDTQARDGVISLAEFVDYYKDVSPTICAENVFANMIKNTWGL